MKRQDYLPISLHDGNASRRIFFALDVSPAQRETLFNVFIWFFYGTGAHASAQLAPC